MAEQDTTTDALQAIGLPAEAIPAHIAIIMDGNGRWAKARGLPRLKGHQQGARVVRETLKNCDALGVKAITLFSFSSENWKRPPEEVAGLMALYEASIEESGQELIDNNIRFRQIGRREGLPQSVLEAADGLTQRSASNTGPILTLAVNYGGRGEIADAARAIARKAASGEIDPETIDEAMIAAHLYDPDLPDPDLLIRTSGELRISNFLLWQLSYAEIFVTETHWPDFEEALLHEAIRSYAARSRRFGAIRPASPPPPTT